MDTEIEAQVRTALTTLALPPEQIVGLLVRCRDTQAETNAETHAQALAHASEWDDGTLDQVRHVLDVLNRVERVCRLSHVAVPDVVAVAIEAAEHLVLAAIAIES